MQTIVLEIALLRKSSLPYLATEDIVLKTASYEKTILIDSMA